MREDRAYLQQSYVATMTARCFLSSENAEKQLGIRTVLCVVWIPVACPPIPPRKLKGSTQFPSAKIDLLSID